MNQQQQQQQPLANLAEERENIIRILNERLDKHDNSRKIVQDRLHEICDGLRTQADKLENKINKEIEELFTEEDNRLQAMLNSLRESTSTNISQVIQKAKADLLVMQSYEVVENIHGLDTLDLNNLCKLDIKKHLDCETLCKKKPANVRIIDIRGKRIFVAFNHLNSTDVKVLHDYGIEVPIKYKCVIYNKWVNEQGSEYPLEMAGGCFAFTPKNLEAGTTYEIRVKMVFEDRESEWSDGTEFTTPDATLNCGWKECPEYSGRIIYSVDENNPRIVTMVENSFFVIAGNTSLPINAIPSWNIKILKSERNDGYNICVGVTSPDVMPEIDQYESSLCGWYYNCYTSTLCSGPPHNYKDKGYGPRKSDGNYVHTENTIGVVMDTTKGELSFVLNGVNYGVAYKGIPLDKPLVPCAILANEGDSVELDLSGVRENVNSSIPVPPNIRTKNITWDSITLTWGAVEGASFYQIEMDNILQEVILTTNTFTKLGLFDGASHNFRVRTVRNNAVSEWSNYVGAAAKNIKDFSECAWKKCPDHIIENKKYYVDEKNPRIASLTGYICVIIGNMPIPSNNIKSWGIKILKSVDNDGRGILVGVAPFDIDQNERDINKKCGWYFDCHNSFLQSGPPHNYKNRPYGPRKNHGSKYVRTGDSVGVVMNTTTGDLSFALKKGILGTAYTGIPLDKPLVPCVTLLNKGDSVMLHFSDPVDDESCVIS